MSDPLDAVDWPLRTERLSLRRATADDAAALWAHRRLPEVTMWITNGPADFEDFLSLHVDPARLATTLVIELATPDGPLVIGDVMLRIEDGWAQREVVDLAHGTEAELGWTLHPDHAGRGYATEAVRGVIATCFGVLGLRRVHAGCFAANEPSWRLMERVGMEREEFSRKTGLHRSGVWMDGMHYGVLAEDWTG